MITIVAGLRSFRDAQFVSKTLSHFHKETPFTYLITGAATGVDTYAERWAFSNAIMVHSFPAKWDEFGKRAGPIRNAQMAEQGERLIAFWDGKSAGTGDMVRRAKAKGMPVEIVTVVA